MDKQKLIWKVHIPAQEKASRMTISALMSTLIYIDHDLSFDLVKLKNIR